MVADAELREKITLGRIRELYGADIALLLSYQQDQLSSQKGWVGLADLTIIGAFLIPGVVTKTTTVVDGKVIHIPNEAMIFRTEGSSERTAHSPAVDQRATLRDEAIAGVLAATAELGRSLLKTLAEFDRYDLSRAVPLSVVVAGQPAGAGATRRSSDYWERVEGFKSAGGGALGFWPGLIAVLACWAAWRRL